MRILLNRYAIPYPVKTLSSKETVENISIFQFFLSSVQVQVQLKYIVNKYLVYLLWYKNILMFYITAYSTDLSS